MASKYGINYKDYQDSDEVKRLRAANLAKEQVLSQANDRLSQPTQYGTDYADAIKQYNNRQPFQYDVASDALYNQYKDQYVKLGKTAAENVAAQSANLTGGYGNSYGTVASNQAYQDYLGKLNDIIPQLYDRARDQYDREGNDILNRINVLGNADQMEYGRNQDAYNRALGDLQLGLDQYNNERNFDYGKYSDDRSYVTNNYWQGASMQQADDQFKAQQAQRDKELAEEQRQFNLNYKLQQAAQNSKGSGSGSGGGNTTNITNTTNTENTKKVSDGMEKIRKDVLGGLSKARNEEENDKIAAALTAMGYGADSAIGQAIYLNLRYGGSTLDGKLQGPEDAMRNIFLDKDKQLKLNKNPNGYVSTAMLRK